MATRVAKKAKEVYRGYMPIDLPQNRPRVREKWWWKVEGRPRVTLYPKQEIEGYSSEAEYPPIENDGSRKSIKDQIRLDWYEKIRNLPTVEQKIYETNRHAKHYIAHIQNWLPNYNSLPLVQYLTQTNLINALPDRYTEKEADEELINRIKKIILDQIALDNHQALKKGPKFVSYITKYSERSEYVSNRSIQNIVTSIKKALALKVNPQLLEYQYDLSPAISSWCYHSGFRPPNHKMFFKSRKDEEGNINQMVQIHGTSALALRSNNFLRPVISLSDSLVTDKSMIPNIRAPLKEFGAMFTFREPITLPGFWYQDAGLEFPHTCFLSTDCLKTRQKKNYTIVKPLEDAENCLTGQAILSSFNWLNGLSSYHGYTTFDELTYPFTSQAITTDGQNWLFNVYQLNCHTFHRDLGGPKLNNICWTSGLMKLYETYKDGEFYEVNDEVVRLLIQFLAQKTSPEYTSELNLRPYLGEDTRTQEEKDFMKNRIRRSFEGRYNHWLAHQWKVPLYEHLFFKSKVGRNRLTHMKARWHIPKPTYPKIFE